MKVLLKVDALYYALLPSHVHNMIMSVASEELLARADGECLKVLQGGCINAHVTIMAYADDTPIIKNGNTRYPLYRAVHLRSMFQLE